MTFKEKMKRLKETNEVIELDDFNDEENSILEDTETDPFEGWTEEEVLEHFGIEKGNEDTEDEDTEDQDYQEEDSYNREDKEPDVSDPYKDTSSKTRENPTKNANQETQDKKTSSKKKKHMGKVKRTKKVITKMFPVNGCKKLLSSKSVDFEELLSKFGEEFYLISLYDKDRSSGFNMVQTLNFLNYLTIEEPYGYFPIYSFDKKTNSIKNIFLLVFNYIMTPSYKTEFKGNHKTHCFHTHMERLIKYMNIGCYIVYETYKTKERLTIYKGGLPYLFQEDVDFETLVNIYSKELGSYSPTCVLATNDLPYSYEYDYRTMKKEICVLPDILTMNTKP